MAKEFPQSLQDLFVYVINETAALFSATIMWVYKNNPVVCYLLAADWVD